MKYLVKKVVISLIISCVLLISTLGAAVPSIEGEKEKNYFEENPITTGDRTRLTTQEATTQIASTAEKYFSLSQDTYKSYKQPIQNDVVLPWVTTLPKGDFLEWVIHVKYKNEDFYQEVDISIFDFQETFLKHPEYGRIMYFDVDRNDPNGDPEDDLMVIIGFYWSIIRYPDGSDYKSLETRFRVRQLETGGYIADDDALLEVWSEIHVNVGLIQETARDRADIRSPIKAKFSSFVKLIIDRVIERRANRAFSPLKIILDRLYAKQEIGESNNDIQSADANDDYISVGAGYRSPDGEEIPLLVEKRFSFAKGLRWRDGSIFKPAIFQHQMSPGSTTVGDDIIELLYGFRAHEAATNQDKFDVEFGVEFEPAVNLKTKYIPLGGYLQYYLNIPTGSGWGGWTPRSQPTKMSFTAHINKGQGDDVPKLILELDKIDGNLADNAQKWFSFDIDGINKFTYSASHRFNVGITVDLPGLFSEKIEIKGLPTSVVTKWGIDELAFSINQNSFYAALDVYADLSMSSSIDRVTVMYPKFEGSKDAPDSPFLQVGNIPSKQRASAGGHLNLAKSSSNVLTVDVGGNAGLSSSGNILDATLFYPKSDWYNDPDMALIDIPGGLPGQASAQADAELRVNLDNLMDPANRVYGNFQHGFNSNVNQIDIYLPEAELPILRFTDIPAYAVTRGELLWGVPQGYAFSSRNAQNKDPIELNLEYGDYELYDKLEIRDGHITTSFKLAESGYFNLDTTKHMFKNDLRFNNYANGNQVLLYVEDVSAQGLETAWDIDTSGQQLQINSLAFDGIIDTIESLEIGLSYEGKQASFDLDWHVGQQGNFEIEITQEDDLMIDFSDIDPFQNLDIDGYVLLDNEFDFDVEWKLDTGQSPQDPGYFRVNKYHDHANIKEFELDIFFTSEYGMELYLEDPDLYMDLEWYFDLDDPIPPYIFFWFDVLLDCDVWSCYLTWTDIYGNTDRIWIPLPS